MEVIVAEPIAQEVLDASGEVRVDEHQVNAVDLLTPAVRKGRGLLVLPEAADLGPRFIHSTNDALPPALALSIAEASICTNGSAPDAAPANEEGELFRALTIDPIRDYQPLNGRWPVHNVLRQASTMS